MDFGTPTKGFPHRTTVLVARAAPSRQPLDALLRVLVRRPHVDRLTTIWFTAGILAAGLRLTGSSSHGMNFSGGGSQVD
eukprot:COSAG01_NODE_41717_length_448_cov_0.790831_1_plen_78_part_10